MSKKLVLPHNRRDFLGSAAGAGLAALVATRNKSADGAEGNLRSLDGVVGITTGGGLGRKRERGELTRRSTSTIGAVRTLHAIERNGLALLTSGDSRRNNTYLALVADHYVLHVVFDDRTTADRVRKAAATVEQAARPGCCEAFIS